MDSLAINTIITCATAAVICLIGWFISQPEKKNENKVRQHTA